MKREYSAGIIIYFFDEKNSDVKFLLVKHKKGHWAFPKGHIEDGEDIKSAAIREVEEETGLKDIKILKFNSNNTDELILSENYIIKDSQVDKTNYYFIGELDFQNKDSEYPDIKIDEKEITNYCWCQFNEALNLITYDKAKELLKKAYDIIKTKILR